MRRLLRAVCATVGAVLCMTDCEETQKASSREHPPGITLYVATNGNDAWSGEIRWLGTSACEDADGVFYLDNVALRIE